MDYEKKYNEALEKARKLYNDAKANEYKSDMEDYESIFPELTESEDERIRKALIDALKTSKSVGELKFILPEPTREECIAYLEKQKDSASNNFDDVWDEEDCEEIIAEGQKLTPRFKELLKEVCHAWYDRGAKLEKQKEQKPLPPFDDLTPEEKMDHPLYLEGFDMGGEVQKVFDEQKPVEWSDTKELVFKDICNHLEVEGYSGWVVLLNALRNGEFQPKQEWSEEDEKTIDDAFCWLCEYAGSLIQKNYGKSSMLYGIANKLKSLHPHPKQEWSEEEKEILDSILSHYVLIDKPTDANGIPKEKYISLIKSIRFDTYKKCNSHWKPSEEQMNALYDILHPADTVNRLALESLYEQLKAL